MTVFFLEVWHFSTRPYFFSFCTRSKPRHPLQHTLRGVNQIRHTRSSSRTFVIIFNPRPRKPVGSVNCSSGRENSSFVEQSNGQSNGRSFFEGFQRWFEVFHHFVVVIVFVYWCLRVFREQWNSGR